MQTYALISASVATVNWNKTSSVVDIEPNAFVWPFNPKCRLDSIGRPAERQEKLDLRYFSRY